MKKNKRWLPILSVVILAIFGTLYFYENNTLSGRLFKYGIKISTDTLKLTDKYRQTNGVNVIETTVADSSGIRFYLSHIIPQDSKKYIDDKIYSLKSLYEPTTSPYPEVITNVIDCPSEFKPVLQNFDQGVVYKLFAGERYNYGICTQDLIKYDSFYALFDCGKKGVFEIRVFNSNGIDKIEGLIKSFSCNG